MTLQSPNEALQPELPPPPPPRKRRPTLSAFSGFLSFLLLLSIGGFFGVIWGVQRLKEPGSLASDKVLYIAPGTDFPDIVSQLEAEGVIDNSLVFNVAVVAEGKRSRIKAGEYLFKQSASMRDVIAVLVSGRQVLHSVTIPEGLTSEQVVDRLRHNNLLQGEIREIPKEGSLLPETYKVPRNMSRSELILRMQEDEKKLVAQIWARRASDLILRSPYELVTLASIVEKETGKADERPRVAAVFLNRLRKHMRLQSDPTIVYGLVGGKGTLGRPILRSEVDRPTPYNTYVIEGLPPTPIDNPGRAALEAVANPSHTQELYFVADGTGGHVFATTLDQHVRNVKRWRLIEKEAKEKSGTSTDVDHVLPQPATGRSQQRGELDTPSIYGALPNSFDSLDGRTPSLGMGNAALAMAALDPQLPKAIATAVGKPQHGRHRTTARTSASKFEMTPGLDQLGITVRGVSDSKVASALLDGPIDANKATPPAAPEQVASSQPQSESTDPATQSASLAFIPGGEPPPPAPASGSVKPQQQAERPVQQDGAPVHRAIYDASEGTSLDPLRDKTYDLNYAKTVPTTASLQ